MFYSEKYFSLNTTPDSMQNIAIRKSLGYGGPFVVVESSNGKHGLV
jgi:hypothetical protein